MNNDVRVNMDLGLNTQIEKFYKEVLSEVEIAEAKNIFSLAVSGDEEKEKLAGLKLSSLIPAQPKRPLYYVNYEVSHGSQMITRYVVHFLGAYIDNLLECYLKNLGGYRKFIPFGGTLKKLKGKIPQDLYFKLDNYNKIFYRPAKHEFELFNQNNHLFSLQDAIFCCFITMKLTKKITELSGLAKLYSENKIMNR